jgi:hypothetical protein
LETLKHPAQLQPPLLMLMLLLRHLQVLILQASQTLT